MTLLPWHQHRWSFPIAEGHRINGKFIRTGPDVQNCLDCGARRESPIQFHGGESRAVEPTARLAEAQR